MAEDTTGVTTESQAAFLDTDTQKDTATDSSTDNKPTDTTPPAAGDKPPAANENVPWHKDPRWQEWQDERKTLKATVEELLPLKDLASRFQAEPTKIPSWFTRLYGEDQAAWQEYQTWDKSRGDEIKSSAIKEYEAKQKQQADAIADANEHFKTSVAELTAAGETVDSNKLLKFVMDNDLVDSTGKWNYKAGFKFMRDLEKAATAAQTNPITDAKKATSDQSISTSKEKKGRNYETPQSMRGKSFLSL